MFHANLRNFRPAAVFLKVKAFLQQPRLAGFRQTVPERGSCQPVGARFARDREALSGPQPIEHERLRELDVQDRGVDDDAGQGHEPEHRHEPQRIARHVQPEERPDRAHWHRHQDDQYLGDAEPPHLCSARFDLSEQMLVFGFLLVIIHNSIIIYDAYQLAEKGNRSPAP